MASYDDFTLDITPLVTKNHSWERSNQLYLENYNTYGYGFIVGFPNTAPMNGRWITGTDPINFQVGRYTANNENYFKIDSVGSVGNNGAGGVRYTLDDYLTIVDTTVICWNYTAIAVDEVYISFWTDDNDKGFTVSPNGATTSQFWDSVRRSDQTLVYDYTGNFAYEYITGYQCIGGVNITASVNHPNRSNLKYLLVEMSTPGDARNFYLSDIGFYNISLGYNETYNETTFDLGNLTDEGHRYQEVIPGGMSVYNSAFFVVFFGMFIFIMVLTNNFVVTCIVMGVSGFIFSYLTSGTYSHMYSSIVLLALGITIGITRGFS
jgi:hypothetical protein